MKNSKLEAAKNLAKTHLKIDSDLKHVFLLEPLKEDDRNEPIKLLEIVEGTLEIGVEPIVFGADPNRGIDYPSMIVEISPKEYGNRERLKTDLRTRGWRLGQELVG